MAENIKDPTFEEQPEPDGSEPVESIARFETESVSGTDTEKDPDVLEPAPHRMHKDAKAVPLYGKNDKMFLAGALLLGILFTWLFYGKYPGVSVPLFTIAFYALFFAYVRPVPDKKDIFGWFLCIPVLMISLTFLIFRNIVLMWLNILTLPWLIVLQTILVTGTNSFKWYSPGIIADLLFGAFARCLIHIAKPFRVFGSIVRSKKDGGKKSIAVRVVAGLAVALPILLVLLLLLASADMVFGKLVEKLPEFLNSLNAADILGKALLTFFIFLVSFSFIWSLKLKEKFTGNENELISGKSADEKRRWDPVILITATACIDLLYVIFVIIQFAYLFGRSGLPEGFTYSEYARKGFTELILVSLLNIGFLGLTLTYAKKGTRGMDITFRILNTITVCCTYVILLSAYYRMLMYEEAYGFTFLRIMTQAFMIFLFVLFSIALAGVWNDRVPLLKSFIAVAVVAFTIINYINVDAVIARKNVDRYFVTGEIDLYYLNSLSKDAASELVRLADADDPEVAEDAAKMLEDLKERQIEHPDWQSFNLTEVRAKRAIEKK